MNDFILLLTVAFETLIWKLIALCIGASFLYGIYWIGCLWIKEGTPRKILLTILALIFLLCALHLFGFLLP